MKKSLVRLIAAATLTGIAVSPAYAADEFPNKPMRLLVGFAAGGPTDVIARVLAKDMSVALGQTVFVENKAGASSMIATREVKSAAPDGYTLLFFVARAERQSHSAGRAGGLQPKDRFHAYIQCRDAAPGRSQCL